MLFFPRSPKDRTPSFSAFSSACSGIFGGGGYSNQEIRNVPHCFRFPCLIAAYVPAARARGFGAAGTPNPVVHLGARLEDPRCSRGSSLRGLEASDPLFEGLRGGCEGQRAKPCGSSAPFPRRILLSQELSTELGEGARAYSLGGLGFTH